MINITTDQLNIWIATFVYPLARILAFAASAPVFNNAALPRRIRLGMGIILTIAIAPMLPPMPNTPPDSGVGLWILAQQMLIGVGMGFSMRIIYSAIDMAGEFISVQMGLGFATFYDPQNTSQTPVIGNFLGLLTTLTFFAINGHLIYFATLAQSFIAIPISSTPLGADSWRFLAELGSKIFSTGMILALPVVVTLMITNLALGILNRAAPQLNLFAIGFPITMTLGFSALALLLGYLVTPLQKIFEEGLSAMLYFALPPLP